MCWVVLKADTYQSCCCCWPVGRIIRSACPTTLSTLHGKLSTSTEVSQKVSMFFMGPGAGAPCTSTAATAATAVCRVGWVVNANRGQIMRARALSSHVAPSASALSSSGVVVAPRLPLHGCPVTRPMVRGGSGGYASTSAVCRLHLKADSDGVCIKVSWNIRF